MIKSIIFLAILAVSSHLSAQEVQNSRITTNPLNLSYRFQIDGVSRREAADPVIVLFKDRYFLFASHSSGYWYSSDLKNWNYVASKNLKTVEAWAPAVLVYKDAIYYLGMGEKRIYKSTDPIQDQWEEIESKSKDYGDPAFFQDNDGKVYLYYGCSDNAPIKGFEIDPEDGFKAISPEVELIPHNADRFGWEVPGEKNEMTDKRGWNEAPCITRHGDYYYLQYSAPGTEFTTYCTGVYISKNPLGPYTCAEGAPFSIKPGGFITGAGHGHPFKDRYGNDWYVGTMIVSAKDHFERRIGIFPAFYNNGYSHGITDYTDFPFILPNKKVDFSKKSLSANMNLLSYNKPTKASSSYPSCEPNKASDENIKTSWSAATGKKGEWLQMDLGQIMKISALQICFADEGFQSYRRDVNTPVYQYIVEYSTDGNQWKMLIDRSKNSKDQIYELITLKNSVRGRFVRVKNTKDFQIGRFSIADMRLFGKANCKKPENVSNFQAKRQKDRRRIVFSWNSQQPTTGYVIRWGSTPKQINNAVMVYGNQAEFGFFDCDSPYYVTIEAFNEGGKSKKSIPFKID
ncbi:family 43 glycosylhydrolase [Bacteroides faecalis]|uniref:Endo-1,4-beta-xylanase n=1 Tax=Bacteroides faecalis TaxID=2447885 RepID=A0A401M012_9BACE|nr:family 43 glycosylhydrolase [Bacteroides faecalis]GCB37098.1 endo-1,4-beta-xylanase [Bacteroides faecalis]